MCDSSDLLEHQTSNFETRLQKGWIYSCNKITTTQIQISRQIEIAFSQILAITSNHITPIVSRAKNKWYKPKKVQKLSSNSQLLTVQTLKNYVQGLILCLPYFITACKMLRYYFANSKTYDLWLTP